MLAGRLFVLGEEPDYEPTPERSFASLAQTRGERVLGVIYDALLAQEAVPNRPESSGLESSTTRSTGARIAQSAA